MSFLNSVMIHITGNIVCQIIMRHTFRMKASSVISKINQMYRKKFTKVFSKASPVIKHSKQSMKY